MKKGLCIALPILVVAGLAAFLILRPRSNLPLAFLEQCAEPGTLRTVQHVTEPDTEKWTFEFRCDDEKVKAAAAREMTEMGWEALVWVGRDGLVEWRPPPPLFGGVDLYLNVRLGRLSAIGVGGLFEQQKPSERWITVIVRMPREEQSLWSRFVRWLGL